MYKMTKILQLIWKRLFFAVALFSLLMVYACSSGDRTESDNSGSGNLMKEAEEMVDDGKGVGPVKNLELSAELDQKLVAEGESIFESKCTACHKFSDERYVGPGLKGVTVKRKPEWIMNMILNPQEMTQKDPTAKELLAQYMTVMTNQNITEPEARSLLEYLRKMDKSN
ncbi:MAG: cytochrome c [Bacteroidetes bacterium]|nr:MAG: cytochrome c [Bacteroidota bacterium]REK06672.1 MAG: cytochrome c [Bacteroidota bacterium]REK33438.1 MAG: cytochrome c [Bacteroidota bacterium]REK47120.1 MAG: cytochrome c [Bacteroidota bacterium]